MRNKTLLGLMALAFFIGSGIAQCAHADQRFETWQGLCHFAYDTNDDDNEVYFANCKNTINTQDAGDGQGRLAYGESVTTARYRLDDKVYKGIVNGDSWQRGADADPNLYPDGMQYKLAANTACVMVTSNYDAGNDDNNETVYTTNDWNMEITVQEFSKEVMVLRYHLSCRNAAAQ